MQNSPVLDPMATWYWEMGHYTVFRIVTEVFMLWICTKIYEWLNKALFNIAWLKELWLGDFISESRSTIEVYSSWYFASYYHSQNRLIIRKEALPYCLAQKWSLCAIVFRFYSYFSKNSRLSRAFANLAIVKLSTRWLYSSWTVSRGRHYILVSFWSLMLLSCLEVTLSTFT